MREAKPDDPIFKNGYVIGEKRLTNSPQDTIRQRESQPSMTLELTAVDGTKSFDELKQILLDNLLKAGLPVKMSPEVARKFNMPYNAAAGSTIPSRAGRPANEGG